MNREEWGFIQWFASNSWFFQACMVENIAMCRPVWLKDPVLFRGGTGR